MLTMAIGSRTVRDTFTKEFDYQEIKTLRFIDACGRLLSVFIGFAIILRRGDMSKGILGWLGIDRDAKSRISSRKKFGFGGARRLGM